MTGNVGGKDWRAVSWPRWASAPLEGGASDAPDARLACVDPGRVIGARLFEFLELIDSMQRSTAPKHKLQGGIAIPVDFHRK